jgi:RNA polymerase sigma-70 factor, ECF subfamily
MEIMGRIPRPSPSYGFSMVLDANDREVIEACRRGDYDAFRALFDAHKDRIYSIALRYSGDPATAMDIAQETFLKLLSSIQDFRGSARFESWLYRVVVNACLDHRRRGRRLIPFLDGLIDAVKAPAESVLNKLMRAEEEQDVQRVVSRLRPDQRIVVVLRYTEGLSYDQIAELMGCSPGTVASRLSRAHKVLERRLSHLRMRGGFSA